MSSLSKSYAYLPLALLTACAAAPFQPSPHYATVTKHLDVGGQVLLYSDVDGDLASGADYLDKLVTRIRATHPDVKLDRFKARRILEQLGLDQILALGLSSIRDGKIFHNKAFFAYGKERRGLLLMTAAAPHELDVIRAPGDADIVFESDLKLKSLVDLIESLAKELVGDEAKALFGALDTIVPMTSLSWRQLAAHLDTRLIGVVRIDEGRSLVSPGDDKISLPGFDILVSLDDMAVLFDAYADLLRSFPMVASSTEGDMQWLEVDARVAGSPWLRPVLAKHAKTGRLFLATSKDFVKEYLADKTIGKRTLGQAPDFKRATARFLPTANGLSYVSGAFLGKVGRFVQRLAKKDEQVRAGVDLALELLPEAGIPFATQQVAMVDGLYYASYATTSHKSTLFPALAAGPMVLAGTLAVAATSGLRGVANALTGGKSAIEVSPEVPAKPTDEPKSEADGRRRPETARKRLHSPEQGARPSSKSRKPEK